MKILKEKKFTILKAISKYSIVFVIFISVLMPAVFINADGPAATVAPIKLSGGIDNPLGSNGPKDIPSFIEKILQIVMVIGVPIITLAIIYSGFLFVQSQGNSGEIETAKKTFMYTMIGAALLLGAFVISKAIQGTVADITSTTK